MLISESDRRGIRIDSACDEDELQQVLSLEDEYLKALFHIASKIVIEYGSIIQGSGTPTMCDLYWACWLVSNPAYQYESQEIPAEKSKDSKDSSINGWSRGSAWGWKYNSDIHNAREYYDHTLNQIESKLNQALSKKPIADSDRLHLKVLLVRQKLLTRLVERSRRFYYWAPHEIGAYSFQMLIAGIRDRKFILPKEILNQLTLNILEESTKHDNQVSTKLAPTVWRWATPHWRRSRHNKKVISVVAKAIGNLSIAPLNHHKPI